MRAQRARSRRLCSRTSRPLAAAFSVPRRDRIGSDESEERRRRVAAPRRYPNQCAQKRQRPSDFSLSPLKVLVGRVGIEPTTNGLRVHGTAARALPKCKKRMGVSGDVPSDQRRPNICRTKSRRCWSGAALFEPRQRFSAAAAELFPNAPRRRDGLSRQRRAPTLDAGKQ